MLIYETCCFTAGKKLIHFPTIRYVESRYKQQATNAPLITCCCGNWIDIINFSYTHGKGLASKRYYLIKMMFILYLNSFIHENQLYKLILFVMITSKKHIFTWWDLFTWIAWRGNLSKTSSNNQVHFRYRCSKKSNLYQKIFIFDGSTLGWAENDFFLNHFWVSLKRCE